MVKPTLGTNGPVLLEVVGIHNSCGEGSYDDRSNAWHRHGGAAGLVPTRASRIYWPSSAARMRMSRQASVSAILLPSSEEESDC